MEYLTPKEIEDHTLNGYSITKEVTIAGMSITLTLTDAEIGNILDQARYQHKTQIATLFEIDRTNKKLILAGNP